MSVETIQFEFVDTNILVYAFDNSAGKKRDAARALVETLWQEQRGALSVQVLQEFYVTLTRKLPQPLRPEQARPLIADFATWKIYSPTAEDVLAAIDVQQAHG
ncbi:MAG: PIN domain-containing protein, partial [Chloroflexi bacterium]|nr:PIN domain-containing protein [Chloroflexota bacterium]